MSVDNSHNTENFSIIVPTLNEAENIPTLIKSIANINFENKKFEVILVDDNSDDGSMLIAQQLHSHYPWLKMIVRKDKRNLSQSILEGFKHAQYPIVLTLDADLSHPPEKIPELLSAITPSVDMAIGSRYVAGGTIDKNWPLARILSSRLSALAAKIALRLKIKDPLSGFIAIRKETVTSKMHLLQPRGWKIGLEIIVKCGCKKIVEVPIHFSERTSGKSKLSLSIAMTYFHHLFLLCCYKSFTRREPHHEK